MKLRTTRFYQLHILLWSLTILEISYENLKNECYSVYCHYLLSLWIHKLYICSLKFIHRDKGQSIFKGLNYQSGSMTCYYTKCFIKKNINQFNFDHIFCNISINKYPWFFKHFTILINPIHIVVLTCMYLCPCIIFPSFHLVSAYAQWLNDNL